MVKMADPVTLWPDLLITLPTTHYVTNSEDMTMLQILIRSQVRIVVTSQAPHNRAMAGWMLGFTSSPNRHFWMTWSFIGCPLYISAGGHHDGRVYSVMRTALACASSTTTTTTTTTTTWTWSVFFLFLSSFLCSSSWRNQRRIKVVGAADIINSDILNVSLANQLDEAVLVDVVSDANVDICRVALGTSWTECNI